MPCRFRCILLLKQSHETRQDSWDREIASISSWEELQSHVAAQKERWITGAILGITRFSGLLVLQSLQACLGLGILTSGGRAPEAVL